MEIKKYFLFWMMNENEDTTYQSLPAKAVPGGKFIAVNVYMKKENISSQ